MAHVDISLQGKGGAGKSFLTWLLAQWHQEQGINPICFDLDNVTPTLSRFKAFNVQKLKLTKDDEEFEIDQRKFDVLVERIMAAGSEDVVVMDTGTSTFSSLCTYLAENETFDLLQEEGHSIRLHTVLTGGDGMATTMASAASILMSFPNVDVVVWLNEQLAGKIEKNGKGFEQNDLFTRNQDRIPALIHLKHYREDTFVKDLRSILESGRTIAEALDDASLSISVRQRLRTFWKRFSQDEAIKLGAPGGEVLS